MALALPRLADPNERPARLANVLKMLTQFTIDKTATYQKRLSGIAGQVFLIAGGPGRAAMDGYVNEVNTLLKTLSDAEPYDVVTSEHVSRLPSVQDCRNLVAIYAEQARRVEDALLKAYERV